jgi:hypothetical protein
MQACSVGCKWAWLLSQTDLTACWVGFLSVPFSLLLTFLPLPPFPLSHLFVTHYLTAFIITIAFVSTTVGCAGFVAARIVDTALVMTAAVVMHVH